MKITKALLADMRQQCKQTLGCPYCKYGGMGGACNGEVCTAAQIAARNVPKEWTEQDIQEIYETLLDPVEKLIEQVKEAEDEDNEDNKV